MARVLHLSDTHLLGPGSVSPHPDIDPEERLTVVLADVVRLGPYDAVALTGDIADDASVEAVRRVRELLEPLAPVLVAVPGNHDDTGVVQDVFGAAPARVGAWTLRAAATNVAGQVAGQAAPVLGVLQESNGPTAVLMHHPVRSRSTHPWFVLDGAVELERRLEAHADPLVLLSGHLHQQFQDRIGRACLYGAPATFYGIAHDGEEWTPHAAPTGAAIVDLADDGRSSTRIIVA